jgi:metallo-beta-lactamase class B
MTGSFRRWHILAEFLAVAGLSLSCAPKTAPPPLPAISSKHFTLGLESLPPTTPSGVSIYVAGNFNGWNPGDSAYRLTADGKGNYLVALPDSIKGPIEFKFTLGSWDAVETDSSGADIQNRGVFVKPASGGAYLGKVAQWRDPRTKKPKEHTARATVSIMSEEFQMPELGRARRVWIYLPPGYSSGSTRYPVLYMHDGQNVFDNATSFVGEWGVDETLDSLNALGDKDVIVVAVDHGGSKRFDEYSPWKNAKYGGGEGEKYVEFLVKTLKPYVDSHYRTLPDRLNTGVAGSSMGGLISLYAILRYPDVFGRAGIFSPAFWVAPEAYSYVAASHGVRPDSRLYFVIGAQEAQDSAEALTYVKGQEQMVDSLIAHGLVRGESVVAVSRADGKHSESFWRREFPTAYQWMFARK